MLETLTDLEPMTTKISSGPGHASSFQPLLPLRLERGDSIAIFAPAGPVLKEEEFTTGLNLLREAGLEVKFSREIMRRDGYLAGSDRERAEEFHYWWADPDIKALLAVRGGYGALRLLPLLDMNLIRRQPKILIGFSDISVLHAGIYKETGLVTFHGPMLTTLAKNDQPSRESFFESLAGRHPTKVKPAELEIIKAGRAKGRLLGGNLASLVHLVATPYELPWQGSILFLEDVCEAGYRIDRMLTHLQVAGRLEGLAGLILGSFEGCGVPELIWNRVLELTAGASYPIWANFPAGHGRQNLTLPLGQEVEMDSQTGTLLFLGPVTTIP
jgi:muramoyltetrapeptide carboxypeptidase